MFFLCKCFSELPPSPHNPQRTVKKRGNTDAFVKVDEFDFNLLNQTDISFYSGCSIDNSSRKQTSIEIFVEDTSFTLELKGIKKAYSHKSRYTLI